MRLRAWPRECAALAAAFGPTPALLVLSLAACSGDDTDPPVPDAGPGAHDASLGADASEVDATLDSPARGAQDTGADAPPAATVATLRVAHWSPDSPPVDFCLAAHQTTAFGPPLLRALALADDAGDAPDAGPPLSFPGVSAYIAVAPGTYDVRAVVAGAVDCSIAVAPDLTSLGPLAAGASVTIALLGDAHPVANAPPLALAAFADDTKALAAVGLRVLNAASSLVAADFGTGKLASAFRPLFSAVAFGTAGSGSDGGAPDASTSVDRNGYAAVAALSGATLSAHATSATSDAVVATDVSAAAGSLLTFVLIDDANPSPAVRLLECVDNAGTVGLLATCTLRSD